MWTFEVQHSIAMAIKASMRTSSRMPHKDEEDEESSYDKGA